MNATLINVFLFEYYNFCLVAPADKQVTLQVIQFFTFHNDYSARWLHEQDSKLSLCQHPLKN